MANNRKMPNMKAAATKVQELATFSFSFAPNGSSQPVSTSNKGFLLSVTRSAQGKFLATLPLTNGMPKLEGVVGTLQFNGAGTLRVQIGAVSESAGTIEIYLLDNANAAQDLAAAATSRVNVVGVFENKAVS
jgi:hypothetical protein